MYNEIVRNKSVLFTSFILILVYMWMVKSYCLLFKVTVSGDVIFVTCFFSAKLHLALFVTRNH